jgi:hypothetical protein
MSKQLLGQYFTVHNPFSESEAFAEWRDLLPVGKVIEPFAGAGNLFEFIDVDWVGYDIEPKREGIIERDTMKEFPTGYKVCITNPPYLAKTVVSRKKLPVVLNHEDLYLDALERCLDNCEYVAAIIPSTYYNQSALKDRLYAWDKIDYKLFDDTDAPVGVAYFVPWQVQTTKTYVSGERVYIAQEDIPQSVNSDIIFNCESDYLMIGIDTVRQHNIHLRLIGDYDTDNLKDKVGKYKQSNRAIFTLSGEFSEQNIENINKIITEWRNRTKDFFLTSFKSCGVSGNYRKRISFKQLRWLIKISLIDVTLQ